MLGWRLPLAGLPDWVRGRAAPARRRKRGWTARSASPSCGNRAGWWSSSTTRATSGLPSRLRLSRDGRGDPPGDRPVAGRTVNALAAGLARAGQAQPVSARHRAACRRLSQPADRIPADRSGRHAAIQRRARDGKVTLQRPLAGRRAGAGSVPARRDSAQAGDRASAAASKSNSTSAFPWAAGWAAAVRTRPPP